MDFLHNNTQEAKPGLGKGKKKNRAARKKASPSIQALFSEQQYWNFKRALEVIVHVFPNNNIKRQVLEGGYFFAQNEVVDEVEQAEIALVPGILVDEDRKSASLYS